MEGDVSYGAGLIEACAIAKFGHHAGLMLEPMADGFAKGSRTASVDDFYDGLLMLPVNVQERVELA